MKIRSITLPDGSEIIEEYDETTCLASFDEGAVYTTMDREEIETIKDMAFPWESLEDCFLRLLKEHIRPQS